MISTRPAVTVTIWSQDSSMIDFRRNSEVLNLRTILTKENREINANTDTKKNDDKTIAAEIQAQDGL